MIEEARQAERDGDSRAYEGDTDAAKAYFGAAIDEYLTARAFGDAIRTCRKVIRIAPDVARARFTLVFLLTGAGEHDLAATELAAYADAVRAANARSYAAAHLRLLAHATSDPGLRTAIAELTAEFDQKGAAAPRLENEISQSDADARWERLLVSVLRDFRE